MTVAMDAARERRYASAADLARDLTHALEGGGIEARPAGAALQLARWCRRKPAAATAALLAFLMLVGGPIVFGIQQNNAARAQGELTAQVDGQRRLAEKRLTQAMQAVDAMLTRVGLVQLENVPQLEEVRLELLAAAQELYAQLAADAEATPELRLARLRVGIALATLALDMARAEEARPAVEGVATDLAVLAAGDTLPTEAHDLQGRVRAVQGRLALLEGRPEDARAEFEAAVALERKRAPSDAFALASSLHDLAVTLRNLDRTEEALAHAREAVERVGEARGAAPADRGLVLLHVETLSYLGVLLNATGDSASAIEVQSDALELGQEFLQRQPDVAALRVKLLNTATNIATPLRLSGRLEQGLHVTELGLEHGRWLEARFPGDRFARNSLATLELNHGLLLWEAQDREAALASLDAALAGFTRLAAEQPSSVEHPLRQASVFGNRGGLLQELGRLTEARDDLDSAIELHLALGSGRAGQPEYVLQLGVALANRALVHISEGDLAAALDDLRAALPHFRVSPTLWSELAGHAVGAASRALDDPDLDAATLDTLVEGFCDVALDALEAAAASGTLDEAVLDDEARWELLLARDRFQALR